MANTMICALLIAELSSVCSFLFDIAWLWRRAPRSPWGERFKETCCSSTCCCHLILPVVRPEEVEACQCEIGIGNIDVV